MDKVWIKGRFIIRVKNYRNNKNVIWSHKGVWETYLYKSPKTISVVTGLYYGCYHRNRDITMVESLGKKNGN